MVTIANDNVKYNLVELDETRIMTSVARNRIKAFKKRHEADPEPA